ncbi:hypothetical protein GEV33_008787 [Tenebrio molitor]|uniref:Uncharacterized protein n=1 Tax=Tenebrio molitor TaxID=7067 RepID=A0A8J6HFY0_TENMO|nr:hypothetical protein GEV33_008787 [Tenebrio molitor]
MIDVRLIDLQKIHHTTFFFVVLRIADGSDNDPHKHRSSRPHESSSSQQQREREYREKKEREKLAQQHGMKALPPGANKQVVSHGHHRPPVDPKLKQPHSRPPSSHPPSGRAEPRDILREAARDSPFGIATKDYNMSRDHANKSDKDVQKQRDYLLKPNVAAETNSYGTSYNGEKPNRPPSSRTIDPNKVPVKHEQVRRHEDKTFVKPESDVKRSHSSVPGHDRNSVYLNKSMNSTSQKVKSPFTSDTSKSVLKPGAGQPLCPPVKQHHHNGSSSSSYSAPLKEEVQIKEETQVKEEPPNPVVKKPSLFSPEKSPFDNKLEKSSPTSTKQSESFSFPALSPLESPTNNTTNKRVRNYSTGSEPELRPVMKKIDQVEGFENLMRDSTIGINKLHQIPDIITPITDVVKQEEPPISFSKEMKPPDIIPPLCSDNLTTSQPIVNGIETDPMLISSLLKETPSVPHLPAVANSIQKQETQVEIKEKEHHHKSKKKNKEKHKHKDKDRSKEDKEKKKKHKDKDREKHKHKEKQHEIVEPTEPIKIKIQKDKIQPNPIKIKIPKDVIKTETAVGEVAAPPVGLKIKIPRDIINNCTGDVEKSRKRERDRSSPGEGPPVKMSRSSTHKDSKQNGRHSYNKVSNYNKNSAPPPPTYHNVAPAMYQAAALPQNMYYYPAHMGVVSAAGQPYIYPDGQMYNYYNGGYAFPPEMYQQAPPPLPPGGSNPPLPMDAPPDIPPPPPPE